MAQIAQYQKPSSGFGKLTGIASSIATGGLTAGLGTAAGIDPNLMGFLKGSSTEAPSSMIGSDPNQKYSLGGSQLGNQLGQQYSLDAMRRRFQGGY